MLLLADLGILFSCHFLEQKQKIFTLDPDPYVSLKHRLLFPLRFYLIIYWN